MALIIPEGYSHCVVRFQLSGDDEPIVITFGVNSAAGPPTGEGVADKVFEVCEDNLIGGMSSLYDLVGVTVYMGQAAGPPLVFDSTAAPVTGGQAANPLPQNCALIARKRTGLAGRRGRGRFYLPGIAEAEVGAAGQLSSATLAAWTGGLALMLSDLAAADLPMVVLHRTEGAGVEPAPTLVTALVPDPVIGTQRQRLRR